MKVTTTAAEQARGFQAWQIEDQLLTIDVPTSPVGPLQLRSWNKNRPASIPLGGSAIVLPISPTWVRWQGTSSDLSLGCYAQVPGGTMVREGAGLIIYSPEYVGLSQVGGPVEPVGRLHYIDGCSDSLLVCPAKLGDPCLNLLHLPPGTEQTQHTHPSDRIGIILRGKGICKSPGGDVVLAPGMFWYIPAEWAHSFHTGAESLDVMAWHPDSDFGPSHDWHPMLNRTIVEGVSANNDRHQSIRTTSVTE